MALHAANRTMTTFSFYQGTGEPESIGFLETLKTPNLLENNPNYSMNIMKS